VRIVLRFEQIRIDAPAAQRSDSKLIHAVIRRNTVGKRFVHADDHRPNLSIRRISQENFFKPYKLIGIELIRGAIVETDEIHAAHNPVIVRLQLVIIRVVQEALPAQRLLVEPVRELDDVLVTGFRRNRFVIADAEENGETPEGSNLILQEVLPGQLFIIADVERICEVLGLVLDVLVKIVDGAKITEMPVEGGA